MESETISESPSGIGVIRIEDNKARTYMFIPTCWHQVNEFVKIARAANIRAYIIFQLKNDITAMTGKAKTQRRLIDSLHDE